jgi:hypothetical protein
MSRLYISIIASVLLAACAKKENSSGRGAENLSRIEISGAKSLFIAHSSIHTSSLLMLTSSGDIAPVAMLDKAGRDISQSLNPSALLKLDNDFMAIFFDGYMTSLVVGIPDGTVAQLPEDAPLPINDWKQSIGDVISRAGNYLMYISRGRLVRVDMTKQEKLSYEILSAEADKVIYFCADKYGNAAYYAHDVLSASVLRHKSANGGYNTLPGYIGGHIRLWTDFEKEKIFYFSSDSELNLTEIKTDPFRVEKYGSNDTRSSNGFEYLLKIKNKKRIVGISSNSYAYNVYSPEAETYAIANTDLGLSAISYATSSGNYYYLAGTDLSGGNVLKRVDPVTNNYENIDISGHEIYLMSANNADDILFAAYDQSKDAVVIGVAEKSGQITILDTSYDSAVSSIIELNPE